MNTLDRTTAHSPKPRPLEGPGSFNGIYRAVVVVRDDPEKQHRIKVKCPQIYGEIPKDELPWCYPMMPAWADNSGQFGGGGGGFTPPLNAPVGLFFEGGDVRYPVWFGGWWGNQASPVPTPNHAHDSQGHPDNHYFTTPRGTTVQLDDRNGEEKVLIRLPEGDYISVNKTGVTEIRPDKEIDAKASVRIQIQSDSRVEIKATSAVTVYTSGNAFVQADGNVNVKAGQLVAIDAPKVAINGGQAIAVGTSGQTIDTSSKQTGH